MKSSCIWLYGTALSFCLFLILSPIAGQEIERDTVHEKIRGSSVPDTTLREVAFDAEEPAGLQLTALRDKAGAERWWYGWLAGYSAATAGQAIVCFSSDNKTLRQDMVLGAATTFLGAMGQLVTPVLPNNSGYPSYRDYASGEASLSSEQAAELLKALAAREKEGRSWKTHLIAGVVNLSSGLITWLGYKRTFMDGLENFALNTAITEAQIWTQPMKAVRDYEKYCRSSNQSAQATTSVRDGEWNWSVCPGGFYVRYVF